MIDSKMFFSLEFCCEKNGRKIQFSMPLASELNIQLSSTDYTQSESTQVHPKNIESGINGRERTWYVNTPTVCKHLTVEVRVQKFILANATTTQ